MLTIAIVWSLLFTAFVFRPILKSQERKQQEALVHAYRHYQYEILRSRYPALRELTDREISKEYDIDRIFWRI